MVAVMPTTPSQRAALDTAFWSARWNGTDPALTGTALTWDYTQARLNGSRGVVNYKNEYDASYGMTDVNQAFFAAGSDGYDSSGNKILALCQGQRDAGAMMIAAMNYGNPVMPAGYTLAGQHMLDIAIKCALLPFTKTNIYYGTNQPVDTSVAAGHHAVTTVPSTSPDYMGFPWLEYPNTLGRNQYYYTSRLHDVSFLDKEILHAFLLLSESSWWNIAPADGGSYSTYGAWITAYLPQIFGVSDWLLFGGTTNYYSTLVPTAINTSGYGAGGAIKAADDAQEVGLTHRLACNANLCLFSSLLASKFATSQNGWAVKANYYLYFAQQYDEARRAAQVLVAPVALTNAAAVAAGIAPLGISGYHPEEAATDGQGYDVNYSTTTLFELEKTYARWPDSTYADTYLLPELQLAYGAAATRVNAASGVINCYEDTRVNPYQVTDSTSPYYQMVTGQPIVLTGGTQNPIAVPTTTTPYEMLYAGEVNNATNTANEKTPSYEVIPNALMWGGGILSSVTGSDTVGGAVLGARACLTRSFAYVAPNATAPVSGTTVVSAAPQAMLSPTGRVAVAQIGGSGRVQVARVGEVN